mgnify:CR=1 FL=1
MLLVRDDGVDVAEQESAALAKQLAVQGHTPVWWRTCDVRDVVALQRTIAQAEQELASYSSDLALVFEPVYLVDFQVVHAIPQPVNVVMRADFKRKADELKVGAGVEGHRAQTGGSCSRTKP